MLGTEKRRFQPRDLNSRKFFVKVAKSLIQEDLLSTCVNLRGYLITSVSDHTVILTYNVCLVLVSIINSAISNVIFIYDLKEVKQEAS